LIEEQLGWAGIMVYCSGRRTSIRPKILALAVMSYFAANGVWANPTGPTPLSPDARSISEGADTSIIDNNVSGSACHGIDLHGTNKVAQFDPDTLSSGDITFNNASHLLNVTGNMLAGR
jgi:hypothetical protein